MSEINKTRRIKVPRCGLASRWRVRAASRTAGSEVALLPAPTFEESVSRSRIPRSHEEIDRLVKEGAINLDSREWGPLY